MSGRLRAWSAGLVWLVSICFVSAAFGSGSGQVQPASSGHGTGGVLSGRAFPKGPSDANGGSLPVGVEKGWWSKVQENIRTEEYSITWDEHTQLSGLQCAWHGHNRAHGFETYFKEKGVRLARRNEGAAGWEWGLDLVSWGREGALQDPQSAKISASANRIDLDRGAIQEWYINDERGLEQGFTVLKPPAESRRGGPPRPPVAGQDLLREGAEALPYRLHLDLALTGTLHPRISEDGQAVDFRIPGGNVGVLRYAQLKVTDATGRVLPSRFEGWCGYDGQNAGGGQNAVVGGQNAHPTSFHQPSTLNPQPSTVHQPSTAAAGGLRISIDDAGAIYPITVDPLATSPSWTADGENAGDALGSCVATAGDVNGDGYSDVLACASNYASNTGKVYLYLGSPSGLSGTASWTKTGDAAESYFGLSAATAGDVNGDGYSDVVIGAPMDSGMIGKAYLYLGGSSGLSDTPSWTKTGDAANSYFGYSVATAGDVDGDGYSDVVVGAPGDSGMIGKAYLYLGGSSGLSDTASWTKAGDAANSIYGISAATAGDVNGDGFADVVIGSMGYSTNSGWAYVYLGGTSGLSATAFWTETGENPNDQFGSCVSTAGDVNGDGYADVLVGALGYDSSRGKVYLYLGSVSGLSASWSKTGENTGDEFGKSMATAGDANGDGYADVLVGARRYSPSGTYYRGKAYLFVGGSSGLSDAVPWSAVGEGDYDHLGTSVATAGDVNGDGFSDILVGAPGASSSAGRAYLFQGGGWTLPGAYSWSHPGENLADSYAFSVASAGDVNGDGYDDVLVGAPTYINIGRAYLYLGGSGGLSYTESWTADGEASGSRFGHSVASAGDVNGDGYADVVVGAPMYSSTKGRSYLYLGGPTGLSASASWAVTGNLNEHFGKSVASAGDVNGDGYSDLLVGAPNTIYPDKAYLYLGGPIGLPGTPSWTASGEAIGNNFGNSVSGAGDVNGDGYSDIVVSAYRYSSFMGKVYVYMGSASGLSSSPSWTSSGESAASSYFGYSVAGAGDVNGDGYSDLLVSAYYYGGVGRVYLYPGGAAGLSSAYSWTADGEMGSSYFGRQVARAGDVNGDGYSDVIVGAPGYSSSSGRAYIYLGGATGLTTVPAWMATGDAASTFGTSVAAAGDVNGDGFPDVLVGSDETAYMYFGNGGPGVQVKPWQFRAGSALHISPLGRAVGGLFDVSFTGRAPFGRGRVKLQWQTAPLGGTFDPALNPIQSGSSWSDSGTGGATLDRQLTLVGSDGPYLWRVRAKYDVATTPFQVNGPWFSPAASSLKETDLRKTPTCILPTGACSITSVVKGETSCTFTWQDPNASNQRTGCNVRVSTDATVPMGTWIVQAFNIQDEDAVTDGIQWTDTTETPPASTVIFYQITSYNFNCPADGPF